jgi:hypothetical protein
MSLATELEIMAEVQKAMLTLPEVKVVYMYRFTAIDREGLQCPVMCVYFEEESIDVRNRVDMITGLIHIETVWVFPSGRIDADFWKTFVGLKARIQAAIIAQTTLFDKLTKFTRLAANPQIVSDDELHLTQDYRITFGTKADDLTTQTIT